MMNIGTWGTVGRGICRDSFRFFSQAILDEKELFSTVLPYNVLYVL